MRFRRSKVSISRPRDSFTFMNYPEIEPLSLGLASSSWSSVLGRLHDFHQSFGANRSRSIAWRGSVTNEPWADERLPGVHRLRRTIVVTHLNARRQLAALRSLGVHVDVGHSSHSVVLGNASRRYERPSLSWLDACRARYQVSLKRSEVGCEIYQVKLAR